MGLHGNSFISFAGVPLPVGGWVELDRTTLGSPGDVITVSGLADKRYLMILNSEIASGSITGRYSFNNIGGTSYAFRVSNNGAADSTATSLAGNTQGSNTTTQQFTVGYVANLSAEEKLHQWHWMQQNTAGAANVPGRSERVGKFANTAAAINRVDNTNVDTGDFATDSEMVILGWDPTDTHTTNFWEQLVSTDFSSGANITTPTFTTKKYLWIQVWAIHGSSSKGELRVGNTTIDTAGNYASRYSADGGADVTAASTSALRIGANVTFTSTEVRFYNIFVVNVSGNEKLFTSHESSAFTAGAANAPKRSEVVAKWVNTSNQLDIVQYLTNTGNLTAGTIKVYGAN